MAQIRSVTWCLQELKAGDEAAAAELWRRYFHRLAALARQRLGEHGRRVQDEHDMAVRAFRSLCEGAARGDLAGLDGRDDLWRLLATITVRKVAQHFRQEGRQKRGGGHVRGESVLDGKPEGWDALASPEPTMETLHQLAEEQQRLLDVLENDTLRQIAIWRMEGWTGQEMAEKLRMTRRSVERKLERIREQWSGELNQ